jgi:hypothetical protein
MNLQENIHRIKEVMGLNETFDKGVEPVLSKKYTEFDNKIYVYTLPSKKSEKEYIIKLTFYKKSPIVDGEFSNLKNVAEIDFNLGIGKYDYTGLNEIFYLFSSINKIIDKHKNDFKYFVVHSTKDRLSLYEKVLSKLDYLNLIDKRGSYILYKNKNFFKLF